MVELSLGREFAGGEDDDLAPVHVVTGDLDDSVPSHILVLGVHRVILILILGEGQGIN